MDAALSAVRQLVKDRLGGRAGGPSSGRQVRRTAGMRGPSVGSRRRLPFLPVAQGGQLAPGP